VVIFHAWPGLVPGGYVGVDVFFVISGYLITGILLRGADAGRPVGPIEFYSRRIRRLMPAALTALALVALATVALLPYLYWESVGQEVVASTLYFQNWLLVNRQVDYLNADGVASPLLHFWSLSIEEQFYILWPLLLLPAKFLAAKHFRAWVTAVAALVVASSLAWSVIRTHSDPGIAYFETTTRAWELALGAMLSVVGGVGLFRSILLYNLLSLSGIAAIFVSALMFSKETPFPGAAALLPTIGTCMLLAAGESGKSLVSRALSVAPMKYIGDISYSLYLYHWPVIVIVGFMWSSGRGHAGLNFIQGVLAIVVSVVLAHISKVGLEDRFRGPRDKSVQWKAYVTAAIGMLACTFIGSQLVYVAANRDRDVVAQMASQRGKHPGAMVMVSGTKVAPLPVDEIVPTPSVALKDNPDVYRLGCHVGQKSGMVKKCEFGPNDADITIAIVGDSHAAQWLPAVQGLIGSRKWHVTSYTKSRCGYGDTHVLWPGNKPYLSCQEWVKNLTSILLNNPPDIVIASEWRGYRAIGVNGKKQDVEKIAEGLESAWRRLQRAGIKVVAIRDTPWMNHDVAACVAKYGEDARFRCARSRVDVLGSDPIEIAAKRTRGVIYIDMSDKFCDDSTCRPIIGNVLVYRDSHHMTAEYARTLAFALDSALRSQGIR
jgi:peptidoglycan/LPS O-acetylase OafA/YrhL